MKRKKFIESYGRRVSPWTNVIGILVIIAFGIFIVVAQANKEAAGEQAPSIEQVLE